MDSACWPAGRRSGLAIVMMAFLFSATACESPQKANGRGSNASDAAPLTGLTITGRLRDDRLSEASGVVSSARQPGVFWSQNDSGHEAQLFAYDSTGRSLGASAVLGVSNRDWEALAMGPCPQGRCLFIGDVGDNEAVRPFVTLLRTPEIDASVRTTGPVQQLQVRYPDGPHDVEAMWVAADSSIWLATKRPQRGRDGEFRQAQLYRVPADAWRRNAVAVAQLTDSLPITPKRSSRDWITDAALSEANEAGRSTLAVLTYGFVYVFDADPLSGRPGSLRARCAVKARERYSEGITWLPDGRLMLVNEGRKSQLYRGRCP